MGSLLVSHRVYSLHWGMEVAWWSLGTFSKGMGLKEAEGLFHQIIIRVVPRVPPGWKKGLLCGKSSRCHCTCLVQNSVTDPHSLPFIYLWETTKYGFMVCAQGGPNLSMDASFRYYHITYLWSCSMYETVKKMPIVSKQYRKWNLVHSVLAQWNKHYCCTSLSGASSDLQLLHTSLKVMKLWILARSDNGSNSKV